MNSTPVPWKILSSTVSCSVLIEGWNLAVTEPDEAEVRSFITEVVFDSAFASVPVVQVGLTSFDIDQRDSARLTVSAVDISPNGFKAVISTWAGTRVYAAGFNWFAIGA